MKTQTLIVGAIIIAGLLAMASFAMSSISAQPGGNMQQGQGKMMMDENDERPSVQYKLNKKYHDYKDGVFSVRAGAGGHVAPLTMFFPNHAEIKVGETVVFSNPTKVGEPHTVTFIMDESTFADFAAPFLIDNQTSVTSAVPNANVDPIIMPGPPGQNVIVALNNRSLMPTILDSEGNATYLPPNASYNVTGTEKYINSGFIWPEGMAPPGFPPVNSFSMTFEQEGTYNYICVLHPWMTGEVVVK